VDIETSVIENSRCRIVDVERTLIYDRALRDRHDGVVAHIYLVFDRQYGSSL